MTLIPGVTLSPGGRDTKFPIQPGVPLDFYGNPLGALPSNLLPVFNVKVYGAKGNNAPADTAAYQAAITAASAAGGGIVFTPPGTYLVNTTLPIVSDVRHRGAGRDVSIIKAANTLTTDLFAATVGSGGSVHDCSWEDLTLDGNSTPAGTIRLIHLDTSANINVAYYNVERLRCNFQNAYTAFWHEANNFDANQMNNHTLSEGCRYSNLKYGIAISGTYSTRSNGDDFDGCTGSAFAAGNAYNGPVMSNGAGPTTLTRITNAHVEGLGNLTGAGSGTENGLCVTGSLTTIDNVQIIGVSNFPIAFESAEGAGSLLTNIDICESGGSGLWCDGLNSAEPSIITNVFMSFICQNTGLGATQGCAVALNGGAWQVSHVLVADAPAHPPAAAVAIGADSANQMGVVNISDFVCLSNRFGFVYMANATQSGLSLAIRESPGYNPSGYIHQSAVPAVPASGLGNSVTNSFQTQGLHGYGGDYDVYLTTPAGVTVSVIALGNGSDQSGLFATGLTMAAGQTIRVPLRSGQSISLTYAGGTPTWVWIGH